MLSIKQGGIKYHFNVFGMTRPGIEPRSPGPLMNIQPTVCIYCIKNSYLKPYNHQVTLTAWNSLTISRHQVPVIHHSSVRIELMLNKFLLVSQDYANQLLLLNWLITRNRIMMYKLLVLDRNTWNCTNVHKLFVSIVTWIYNFLEIIIDHLKPYKNLQKNIDFGI